MRQKASLLLTLVAWLFATGAQWDLLQTVAWTRMLADNAKTMSLTQAVEKTFSGEQCALCVTVQEGKDQQSSAGDTPAGKASGKILLVCAPTASVLAVFVPLDAGSIAPMMIAASAPRAAPVTPPPRVQV